jgi:hypothetical protein
MTWGVLKSDYWPARALQGLLGLTIASLLMVGVGLLVIYAIGSCVNWLGRSL